MAAQVSDPIAVADATATVFDIGPNVTSVRVAVVFYDDAGATPDDIIAGSGKRDIAISAVVPVKGYGVLTLPLAGASAEDVPEAHFKSFDLGGPTSRISIACAQAADPEGATHYRVFVDA